MEKDRPIGALEPVRSLEPDESLRIAPSAMRRLLEEWCLQVSEHTRRARLGDLRAFAEFCGLQRDPEMGAWALLVDGQLGARTKAKAWDAHSRERGHKPATRARRLTTLRSLVAEANAQGLPWLLTGIKNPQWDPYDSASGPDPKRVEEVIRWLEERERTRDRAILLLLYDAGLRVSSVLALRKRDLRQSHPHPRIHVRMKGGREKLKRISRRCWDAISAIAAELGDDDPLVSLSYAGVYVLTERLGLGSPHGLRHSAATVLAERTGDVRIVQEFLEHKNLSTSQIYIDRIRDDAGVGSEIVAGERENVSDD